MGEILFKKQEGMDIFEFQNGLITVSTYDSYDDSYRDMELTYEDVRLLFHKMKKYFEQ